VKHGEYPYLARANRLSEFIASKGYKNNSAFARAIDIPQQHVAGYLDGRRNPFTICEKLRELGMDLNHLATGIYTNQTAPVESIPIEHKRILHQLQSHNLCTLGHITRLINIDEHNRQLYKGVEEVKPEEHKPLPRQLVPKDEEMFDGEPEKEKLPDWAAKQVKEKLEKKKKAHKHNAAE